MNRIAILLILCVLVSGCGLTDRERRSNRERSQGPLRDGDWETTRATFQKLALCTVTVEPSGGFTNTGTSLVAGGGGGGTAAATNAWHWGQKRTARGE